MGIVAVEVIVLVLGRIVFASGLMGPVYVVKGVMLEIEGSL